MNYRYGSHNYDSHRSRSIWMTRVKVVSPKDRKKRKKKKSEAEKVLEIMATGAPDITPLSLVEILDWANMVYPGGHLRHYYNRAGHEINREGKCVDLLAKYIVCSIIDSYDINAHPSKQLAAVFLVLDGGRKWLNRVLGALDRLLDVFDSSETAEKHRSKLWMSQETLSMLASNPSESSYRLKKRTGFVKRRFEKLVNYRRKKKKVCFS